MLDLGLLLPSRGILAALLGGLIALGVVALVAEERGAARERARTPRGCAGASACYNTERYLTPVVRALSTDWS